MTTQQAERGKWETLSLELEKRVRSNKNKPKGEKLTLNDLFKDFADEFGTTEGSARKYYYTDIKPKIDTPLDLDKSIGEFSKTVRPDVQLQDPRTLVKIGEIHDATIISVTHFGAFAKLDVGVEGLIHISQITGKEFVDMAEDYFYVGEHVKVKVREFTNDGKIGLSTRAIGGKEKINPAFIDLSNKIMKAQLDEPKVEEPKVIEIPTPIEEPTITVDDKDMDNVIQFIKKYSDNNVSQKALSDIQDMISKFGVFQTTLSLVETVRDLDISSFITEMTKDKLDGEYLRRNTKS